MSDDPKPCEDCQEQPGTFVIEGDADDGSDDVRVCRDCAARR